MTTTRISVADRAVFDLVSRGAIGEAQQSLYPKQIARLTKAGLIEKEASGSWRPAKKKSPSQMTTLATRVPEEYAAMLDQIKAPSRSAALRALLDKALRPEVLELLDLS